MFNIKTIRTALAVGVIAAASLGATTARAETTRILVIPFTALNVPDSEQWISRAVMETLVADLGRAGAFSPVAFQGQLVVEDNATALRVARQASANYVIRGSAQVIGPNVRLTAQLIDARSGDTVNTAVVTGPTLDMLKLEDDLSTQLRGVSAGTPPAPGAPAGAAPTPTASTPQPVAPQIVVVPQYIPSYDTSSSYYPYNYYNGIYPGFYSGYFPGITTVILDNRRHNRDRDHDHDGDHRSPNHTFVVPNPVVASTGPTGGPLVPFSPPGGLVPSSPTGGLVPSSPRGGLVPTSAGTFGGVVQFSPPAQSPAPTRAFTPQVNRQMFTSVPRAPSAPAPQFHVSAPPAIAPARVNSAPRAQPVSHGSSLAPSNIR